MIYYELKLSAQSAQLLFAIMRFNEIVPDGNSRAAGGGVISAFKTHVLDACPFKYFVTHARGLVNEGLIENAESLWRVTKKGRLVAELLTMEFSDASTTAKRATKRLARATRA